jgi:aryl-alcohol dehydrogenase-like predicted oxidoreductase
MGMGCSSLGGGLYYKDDKESLTLLSMAFDSGINFFDTADNYSQGNSERLIGKAFKHCRDRVVIASKGGAVFSMLGKTALKIKPVLKPVKRLIFSMKGYLYPLYHKHKTYNYSSKHLTEAVHKSLKRLQSDRIDIYQLYNPSAEVLERGEVFEVFEMLKKQGKIRHYGVSCVTIDDALICLKYPQVASVQVRINLIDRTAIEKLLPLAAERKLAIIAREPLAQGLFTDTERGTMAERTARSLKEFEDKKRKANQFRFLAKENRTIAQTAIQFLLQSREVSVVIPGMMKRSELKENLAALKAPSLSKEELLNIYSIN